MNATALLLVLATARRDAARSQITLGRLVRVITVTDLVRNAEEYRADILAMRTLFDVICGL